MIAVVVVLSGYFALNFYTKPEAPADEITYVFSKVSGEGEDAVSVVANWIQKQAEQKINKDENGKLYTEYQYTYSVKETVDGEEKLVDKFVWLKETGLTEYVAVKDDPETKDKDETVKYLIKPVKENTEILSKTDYMLKKKCYEEVYGKELTYTFESTDIAGWKEAL